MYTEEFKVRFYETDALAHVSNTVLTGWFEAGREPVFRLFTPELDLQNWPLILASYKVDFLLQIFYGQKVQVKTYIGRIGSSAFDVYQELWQDNKKCASGTTTMVHFDYLAGKSKPIPAKVLDELEKHLYSE